MVCMHSRMIMLKWSPSQPDGADTLRLNFSHLVGR